MTERISTERLREIVDAIDYGEDTGSTSIRQGQREACRELLAILELPEEMESADRFFTASCDCFEDGCDGTGKVEGETCGLCDGSGEFAATSVGEETPDEIIERIKLRDAQHARARIAAEAERDSAQEEVARERERVDRLVPLEAENKRLRDLAADVLGEIGQCVPFGDTHCTNALGSPRTPCVACDLRAALNPPGPAEARRADLRLALDGAGSRRDWEAVDRIEKQLTALNPPAAATAPEGK